MALTTAQRNRLPRSAFGIARKGTPRSAWKYPMPTKAQARRAGISEASRLRTLRAAKAYSARRTTAGSPATIHPVANRRSGGKLTGVTRTARPASGTRYRARAGATTRRRSGGTTTARARRGGAR